MSQEVLVLDALGFELGNTHLILQDSVLRPLEDQPGLRMQSLDGLTHALLQTIDVSQ